MLISVDGTRSEDDESSNEPESEKDEADDWDSMPLESVLSAPWEGGSKEGSSEVVGCTGL